ncbi:anti-sigma-K factor rskA [Mucilaginibacter yixingensis]|uniref:Regulator of SigK n=1 Tax=Mucilaginibacter yixingensis TaxID=1295612 RepID=A0A2T5JCV6_9SPHI|nr:anti-sigma factor [Mucilaginibacter yixingensis]PTQ99590.1 anti-sigma-K factor rskA [Mucilaginibacter yixingensis]
MVEDVKAYIESGILELYVLGEVTAQEKAGVEDMALKHPAVKAELNEIERSLELYAAAQSIEPSEALRDRVLNSLLTNLADDHTFPSRKAPEEPAKVAQLPAAKPNNFYKYAFAACLALLLVSVAALINIYSKLQVSNDKLLAMSAQNQRFSKTVSYQQDQLDMFRDTAYHMIRMKGQAKSPASSMMVAWNPEAKKVMIDMASAKLPVNDSTHQYQLWAIVAGKPVDLGVFDMKPDSAEAMKVMKSVDAPQAFAVTLEPHGGSVNPTLSNMMVLGQF